jgi:hypothetical protein
MTVEKYEENSDMIELTSYIMKKDRAAVTIVTYCASVKGGDVKEHEHTQAFETKLIMMMLIDCRIM